VPRLLRSLLITLLGLWPAHPADGAASPRPRRGRRLPSRLGADEAQDPVEAPDRARARTPDTHHWPGELVIHAGERRTVVDGRWRLTLDRDRRPPDAAPGRPLALDPAHHEVWETELEALLTLAVPGTRLRVAQADGSGWQLLELRAPTQPETVVQLDRAAVGALLGADDVRVELRVHR
jgi:hypothetical protein